MTKSLKIIFIMLLLFVWKGEGVWGQSSKPVLGPDMPRTALVGPDCMVTSFIQTIDVVEGKANIDNLLDTDLTNSMTIAGIADVDLLTNPVLQVKDRKKYYAAGTKAGFCVEGTGGSGGLLSLDLLSATYIYFYKDGQKVGESSVETGKDIGVLGLDVLQIPGSQDAMTYLTAKSSAEFDEIALMIVGVGDISALNTFKIRYAFVGEAEENVLNTSLIQNISADIKMTGVPIAIGWVKDAKNLIDDDFDNFASHNVLLGLIGIAAGTRIDLDWSESNTIYQKGTEVGFVFEVPSLLKLIDVDSGAKIIISNSYGEEEEIALGTSILKVGLIQDEKVKVSIISPIKFNKVSLVVKSGLSVLELGEFRNFYYGYICEPTQVPEICDLGLSMDATICESETQYQLKSTKPVTWSIYSKPNEDTTVKVDAETGLVSDMAPNVTGEYVFIGTSKDNTDCSQSVTLKRGIENGDSQCNKPVTSEEGYELFVPGGTTGGVLPSDGLIDPDNIVDNSMDTYAEYIDGLSLLSVQSIVGVKNEKGNISDGITSKRIGFTVEMPWQALDLTLLKTFQIRAYNNNSDDPVYSSLIERSNVLSLGLIGSEKSAKVRFSIEVPSNISFDRFALWNLGLLNLNISTLRIYGAFVEEVDLDCDDPLGCDAIISGGDELPSATLNYAGTYITGVNVFSGLVNMENLIDGNIDTYATLAVTVGVLNHSSVAINFGRIMNSTHQVGFVLDENTMLGNVDLLKFVTIETYLNGVSTGDSKMDWNVLGADVIGYGDKAYLMMTPTKEYDEVRMKLEGVLNLNLLKPEINIYGVFVRNDADGDGIPDCMDPDSCTGDLTGLAVTKDVCVGDNILLSAIANFKNVDSKEYTLTVSDGASNIYTEKIIIKNGLFEHYFKLNKAGQYTLTLTEVLEDGDTSSPDTYSLTFTVHPSETTWNPETTTSTDWNDWDNWSHGSPWTCTDVIIPTGAKIYPLLESGVMNGCRYIHFEPNTEVVKTHYLTYTKAWVEIELKPDRYYMVSAPLKGIYSGDWFIAKNDEVARSNKFQVWNESSYPENRINPTIYQRVWEAASANRLANEGYEGVYPNVTKTNWTKPFNLLSTEYNKNEGYDFNALSVWVHPFAPNVTTPATDQGPYVFRFPKEHSKYYYYDENGVIQSPYETLKRENTGRFIYEDADSKFSGFPYYMKVRNIKTGEGHNVYLVGNPFMAHIDVEKFLKENEFITSVKVYDGNTNNTIADSNGELLISSTSNIQYSYIAPMQSFFVTMTTDTPIGIILPDYCEVKFTEDMLVGKVGDEYKLKSVILNSDKSGNDIRISAEAEGKKAGALLRFTAEANDNFRDREDSEVLIEDEVTPTVAVFTVAEDYALDIQQRRNGGNIPLGLYMAKPADVTLRIDIPEEYSGWVVEDMETKRVYALQPGKENELQLGRMTTNVGRFYLKGESPTGNEVISASQPRISCYMEPGSGKLTVHSYDGIMERCEVYSIDGSLRSVAKFDSDEYSFPAYKGVNVVKVCFKDGIQTVRKVSCF